MSQVSFDNEKDIQHHVATHLMMDGLNGYKCRLCPAILPTPRQLEAHLIEHSYSDCATFNCYICPSVFASGQELQSHILEHSQAARPFECSRCKQKFGFTAELEHHTCVSADEANKGKARSLRKALL